MKIPEHIIAFASENGFNDVSLAQRNEQQTIYNVSLVDESGFALPCGLPHYIIDCAGSLRMVCDDDFHITSSL